MSKKNTVEKIDQGITNCRNCGTKDDYRHTTISMIGLLELERNRFCNNCDELMDSWACGYWESSSS
jgi:predicted transcriptional regulator